MDAVCFWVQAHSLLSVLKPISSTNNWPFQDYNAKLSDFGLAKDGPEGDKTHVSTRVMGTYGYAAPEYVMTGLYEETCLSFIIGHFYYQLGPFLFQSLI